MNKMLSKSIFGSQDDGNNGLKHVPNNIRADNVGESAESAPVAYFLARADFALVRFDQLRRVVNY